MAGGCDQQHRLLAYKVGNQITDYSCSIWFPPPPLSSPGPQPMGWCPPLSSWVFPSQCEAFPETPSQSECISLVTLNIDTSTRLTATKSFHKRLCNAKEMRHLSRGRYFLSVPPRSRGHLSGARVSSFSPEVSLMSLE